MDSKKAVLILGLLAMVLLISSEVSAVASTNPKEETNGVGDSKYGGGGGYHKGGGGYHGGGGGHGCRYGCCGHGGGYCKKCCSYAGEAVAVETQG